MGEDPSVIRTEIERTRERVGDQVDALSYKTDVAARASFLIEDGRMVVAAWMLGRELPDIDAVIAAARE